MILKSGGKKTRVAVLPRGVGKTATYTATLPKKQHEIVLFLYNHPDRNSSMDLRSEFGLSKYAINRLTTSLESKGYLRKIRSMLCFFELTSTGKNYSCGFATGGSVDSIRQLTHRLHGPLCFVSKIHFRGRPGMQNELQARLMKDNFMDFYPRSGIRLKKRIFQALIIFTPSTVQFHMPEFFGDENEVYNDAMQLLWDLIAYLENEYPGLRIGAPKETARISRQELAKMNDSLAVEYDRTGQALGKKILYFSDRIKIDKSRGVPELETHHRIFAKEDLGKITELYEDVVRGDFDLKDFNKNLANIMSMQQGGMNTMHAIANTQTMLAATLKTLAQDVVRVRRIVKQRQMRLHDF